MNNIGSTWRKWDLHLHTPSSYDYIDKSVTNQQIIDKLYSNQIEVVAITDHHIIDIARIRELQTLGKNKVIILPGIEFRSELGGSNSIHFIGIFPEDSDIEHIWIKIQSQCDLTKKAIKENGGNDKIHCDLKDTCKLIHKLGGIVTVHAGSKSNSLENITNTLPYKMALKTDLVLNHIDILELGKVEDQNDYNQIVFPTINYILPMTICTDNHNIKNYNIKQNLWIKSDPTFEGLLQTIYEPLERVKIQKENPMCDFVKPFFNKISIDSNVNVFDNQPIKFTKQEIVLNPNLVTIIGGRGEGKSILIDYFANGFGLSQNKDFINSLNFNVEYNKSICSRDLINFKFDITNNLDFLYIAQNAVKDIALSHKKLGEEIRRLLHLDTTGFSDSIQEEITDIIDEYHSLSEWFTETNNEGMFINNKKFLEEIKKRNEDLLKSITIEKNRNKLEQYTTNIKEIRLLEIKKELIVNVISELETFVRKINLEILEISNKITNINFDKQIKELKTIYKESNYSIDEFKKQNSKIKDEFSVIYKGDLTSLLESADKYKSNIELINNKLMLVEKKEKLLKESFDLKSKIPKKIQDEHKNQVEIINNAWSNMLEGKSSWTTEQKQLMKNILSDREIELKGKIYFDSDQFYNGLRDCINGTYWRNKNKSGELESYFNITDEASFFEFFKKNMSDELSENNDLYYINDFEDFFYNLDKRQKYLYVQPQLTYKKKTLDKLSVGQRGTLYLCLKLATKTFSTPIIYDQPEDDLDNQFIMNELVDIFKSIKKFRQVIIVTHNANLVVNSDAEQVIVAQNMDESLSYSSGSLENESIIVEVCKILEGGELAFIQRRNRYKLNS